MRCLLMVLVSLIMTANAYGDGAMNIVDVKDIPENEFVFGMYQIHTKTMHLGIPKKLAQLRGFHFEFLSQLSGVKTPEEMQSRKGQGEYAGFGFIREGNQIFVHPISSFKAAGKIGDIHTVNPLLPRPNRVWPAFLPKHLAVEIFSKLAMDSGLSLTLDPDILNSKRFLFNEAKYGAKNSAQVQAMVLAVKAATLYIKGVVSGANRELSQYKLASCLGG